MLSIISRLDKKSKKRMYIILIGFVVGIGISITHLPEHIQAVEKTTVSSKTTKKDKVVNKTKGNAELNEEIEINIDVPLESQFSGVALNNGCEVTALSMLLNFYGYDTNKNQLANLINYVPLLQGNGYRGNPKDGFVGDITGGDLAMGADVEPVAELAEQVVNNDFDVIQSRETSLDDLLKIVHKKIPVWVKVTQEFTIPTQYSFMYWKTTSGQAKVSPLNHACVITGYDEEYIYVNDPYGYKDRAVDKEDFAYIFEQIGNQSLYLKS